MASFSYSVQATGPAVTVGAFFELLLLALFFALFFKFFLLNFFPALGCREISRIIFPRGAEEGSLLLRR